MKPILFNTDMVRAILDGRKTVTRRVVKFKPGQNPQWTGYIPDGPVLYGSNNIPASKSPYHPGDILYVRETWYKNPTRYMYKANYSDTEKLFRDGKEVQIKWHPSIHMPKEAARLFLRVTNVRVERLLTTFFADGAAVLALKKEGMELTSECVECIGNYGKPVCIDADDDSECGILDEIRGDFSDLWNSTIKPSNHVQYGWNANPWVWVIEFERVSKETALKGGEG